MYIHEPDFIYANEDSKLHDVFLCSINNINTDSNDEESSPIMSTTPYKDTWDYHGMEKSAPLQFTLTIAKKEGGFFDAYELRSIKKWLCKGTRNWLQVDQDDISSAFYYCTISNPRSVSVGLLNAGLEFQIICDSMYPWSKLFGKNKTYTSTTTSSYSIYLDTDFDKYIVKPLIIITPKANGDISIINEANDINVSFTNCIANEVISLDCRTFKIKSSTGRVMLDNWNKNVLELKDGNNKINLSGNFTMQVLYRLPIRIGG